MIRRLNLNYTTFLVEIEIKEHVCKSIIANRCNYRVQEEFAGKVTVPLCLSYDSASIVG